MFPASWSAAGRGRNGLHAAHSLKAWMASSRAHLRAALHGSRLAPGSLGVRDDRVLRNPDFLLREAERHGPVFKVWLDGKVTTCILGLARGRRFLAENEDKLRAATTDLVPLFPHGSLRQMAGSAHGEYRRAFIEAFKATPLTPHETEIDRIIDRSLAELASAVQPVSFDSIRKLLKRALTEILFRLILGIGHTARDFDELMKSYERFAPNGIFVVVGREHREIYAGMKSLLLRHAGELRNSPAGPNLLGHFVAADRLDETVIGNLIQMVEAGRFDMMGLWAWLIQILGANAWALDQIAGTKDTRREFCEAVVLEALRLEQSEFIFRVATSDIQFDGHFIPRRSRVRIAVWESHKDPHHFERPFRFDPRRFLHHKPGAEIYAPFGLDKHRCVGADWVVALSSRFVERLALGLRWEMSGDAAPARGVFHFEPSKELRARFRRTDRGVPSSNDGQQNPQPDHRTKAAPP